MLGILCTHPIQYQAPLWSQLANEASIPLQVYYLSDLSLRAAIDQGFGEKVDWGIDLLSGYDYRFSKTSERRNHVGFLSFRLSLDDIKWVRDSGLSALIVNGWNTLAYWEAVLVAHRYGIPVWIRGDSHSLYEESSLKWFMKNNSIGMLLRLVDKCLYVGSANYQLYRRYGVPDSRLHYVPHAIDRRRFENQALSPQKRLEYKKAFGIPENRLCLLFAGKLQPQKRPADLIAAASRLQKQGGIPIHLLFAGTGEEERRLRSLCDVVYDYSTGEYRSDNLTDAKVTASFLGFLNQNDISKAFGAADLLVLPSESETWGLVVNEAIASGLPCVVSDNCGCASDVVAPQNRTSVFRTGDIGSLATSIESTAMNPPSQASMRDIAKLHDIELAANEIAKLWSKKASGAPTPKVQS